MSRDRGREVLAEENKEGKHSQERRNEGGRDRGGRRNENSVKGKGVQREHRRGCSTTGVFERLWENRKEDYT